MLVPRSIHALSVATDADSGRYALGGILLERDADGKPHAVASDGRQLVAVSWDEPADGFPNETAHQPGFQTILSPESIKAAANAVKVRPSLLSSKPFLNYLMLDEQSANGTVSLTAMNFENTATQVVRSIEGRFPRWRDCFPRREGCTTIRLDPKLLASICEVYCKLARTDDNVGVDLEFKDSESCVVFKAKNKDTGLDVQAVLMPLAPIKR